MHANRPIVGVDTAKGVFQAYWVDKEPQPWQGRTAKGTDRRRMGRVCFK